MFSVPREYHATTPAPAPWPIWPEAAGSIGNRKKQKYSPPGVRAGNPNPKPTSFLSTRPVAMTDVTAAILSHPTMTPREFCHVFKTGKQSLYRQLKNKTIPSFSIGNNIRIPTAWALAQLSLGTTEAA
jgi:hypothetical protein